MLCIDLNTSSVILSLRLKEKNFKTNMGFRILTQVYNKLTAPTDEDRMTLNELNLAWSSDFVCKVIKDHMCGTVLTSVQYRFLV